MKPASDGAPRAADCDEERLAVLTGKVPGEIRRRRLYGRLPSNPRCVLCYAPFGRPGAVLMRSLGRGQFAKNPRFCERCFKASVSHHGGCELEIVALFVDVRGSTPLAERIGPAAYARVLDRYYGVALDEMVAHQAFIEITGDEVYGFYLPAFTPGNPARIAIETAVRILRGVVDLELGAGVHAGTAWVGSVGDPTRLSDFRSIGDTVNVGARLVAQAGAGECLISETAFRQAELRPELHKARELKLAGKSGIVAARVLSIKEGT